MQTIGWIRLCTAMAGGLSGLSFVENFTTAVEVVRNRFAHVYQIAHPWSVLSESPLDLAEVACVGFDLGSEIRRETRRLIRSTTMHVQQMWNLQILFLCSR
jgi:hypothetical protein